MSEFFWEEPNADRLVGLVSRQALRLVEIAARILLKPPQRHVRFGAVWIRGKTRTTGALADRRQDRQLFVVAGGRPSGDLIERAVAALADPLRIQGALADTR